MNKELLLIILLFINPYFIKGTNVDKCSEHFESIIGPKCSGIFDAESDYKCYYANNKCNYDYNGCAGYKPISPQTTIDPNVCVKIATSPNEICRAKNENTICSSEKKTCEEYKEGVDVCELLDSGDSDNKQCILNPFNNYKCESHFKTCSGITNATLCNSTILSDYKSYCYMDSLSEPANPTCKSGTRLCSSYQYFKRDEVTCKDLVGTSDDKSCIFDEKNNNCNEGLADCINYEGDNNNTCATYKPIDDNHEVIPLKKCVYDGALVANKCHQIDKICRDYNGEGEEFCETLKTSKTENTRCFLDGNNCKEKYIKCEAFNSDIENKLETNCSKIIPYVVDGESIKNINLHYKCELQTENQCKPIKKECSEISDEKVCKSHVLTTSPSKHCVFKNGKCIEEYATCSHYNSLENALKNHSYCIGIEESPNTKCVFNDNTKECKSEPKECKDYVTGQSEEYCTSIKNDTFRCALINGQCKEQYVSCGKYQDYNKEEDEEINREDCESIILEDESNRCIFEEDSKCVQYPKECSDYTGDSKQICETNYQPLDTDYKCVFIDNKCVERPKYQYCSSYRQKDQSICESIVLSDIYSTKCILQNGICTKVDIPCTDATNAEECSEIILKDNTKKHCVFYNNQCVEKYRSCSDYYGDVEKINKAICEGIIDEKCIFSNETEEQPKGNCKIDDNKNCTDFKVDVYSAGCISYTDTLDDKTKKCVYNSGICLTTAKYCLELTFTDEEEEEDIKSKCESAPTSGDNKKCTINSDGSGCKEIDKDKGGSGENNGDSGENKGDSGGDNGNNDNNNGDSQNNNENNFTKGQYLNKLLIILYLYLLL